jgi:uncharacterized membrane protein
MQPLMTRTYPMRPSWVFIGFGLVFFGGAAIYFTSQARTDHAGIVINRIIELGPLGAKITFGVLAALSAAFVVAALLSIVHFRGGKRVVVVDDRAIEIPGPMWRPAPRRILFAEIRAVRTESVSGQEFLTIVHPDGKATIGRQLVGTAAYLEILGTLQQRVATRAS